VFLIFTKSTKFLPAFNALIDMIFFGVKPQGAALFSASSFHFSKKMCSNLHDI